MRPYSRGSMGSRVFVPVQVNLPPEVVQIVGHVEAETVLLKSVKVFAVSVQNSNAHQLHQSHHSSSVASWTYCWEESKKESDLCPEEQ